MSAIELASRLARKSKVLVVNSDYSNSVELTRCLEELDCEYNFVEVSYDLLFNGEPLSYDLVILDWGVNGANKDETLALMAKYQDYVPMVIMANLVRDIVDLVGHDVGVVTTILKPATYLELCRRVVRLFNWHKLRYDKNALANVEPEHCAEFATA